MYIYIYWFLLSFTTPCCNKSKQVCNLPERWMIYIAKGHVFFIYLIPHWIVCFAFFLGTSPMFIRCSRLSNICCVCFKFLLMLFNEKRLSCIDSPFGWHHSSVYLRMAWPYRILKDIPQSISCMLLNFWWIWIWRPWLRAWAKPLKSSRPSCQGLMLCWGCNTILVVFFRKIYRAKKLRVYKSKRLGVKYLQR